MASQPQEGHGRSSRSPIVYEAAELAERGHALRDVFVLPHPKDVGRAVLVEELPPPASATTAYTCVPPGRAGSSL